MTTGNDLFSQLTPEQLSALLQGGTLQDQGTLLQQQLADLLGSGMQHREYSTPIGAGLGGIAEAMDGTANAFHAKALRGDQQKNLDAQGKLMGDFGALLRGPQQGAAAAPTNQPANPTELSSTWGVDLSQPSVPTSAQGPMQSAEVSPEWGLDLTQRNQPDDPTQIVDNGSDGWGLDLSDPKHVAALTKSLRGSKAPVKLAQRAPRLDDQEFSPFGY